MPAKDLPYLGGYPEEVRDRVRQSLRETDLLARLREKFPRPPEITNDAGLYAFVMELKNEFLKRSPPLSKVCFDDKLSTLHGALGMHTHISRVQGAKTKAKNELRVASLFKTLPPEFLRMVVVHELAHLREKEHNKSFYQLCVHMEPRYAELEFELRLFLTALDHQKALDKGETP